MARQNCNSTPITQPELICTFCTRTFENKKQTSRHVRYCRKKVKDSVSTRQKSCVACIKAKTRCEMTLPSCSRCISKSIQCLYKSSIASSNPEVQGVLVDEIVPVVREEAMPDSSLPGQAAPYSSPRRSNARPEDSLSDPRYPIIENSFDYTISTSTWPDLLSPPGSSDIDVPTFSNGILDLDSLSWNYPPDIFLLPRVFHFKDRVVLGNFYDFNVPLPSVALDTKNILEKRDVRAGPHGSALGRAYCMTTLRSYPGKLCSDDETLPPFIHAQLRPRIRSQGVNDKAVALAEPLEICRSIMRMYRAKTTGNLSFVWRTIGAESQRIEDDYRSWDTWNILASVQAMTVYLILGLLDDNSEYVADGCILRSMCNTTRRIAEKICPISRLRDEELPQDQLPTWEDWALSECRRRTAIILVILIHLFNDEHGSCLPPCGGFADLPLPCCKKLWQAADQETWKKQYRKEYMENTGRGLKRVPTYRDLLPDLQDFREGEGEGEKGEDGVVERVVLGDG
ncbi:hypothetical protein BDZ45DRAFT_800042 [Acephala macrosclerotiorum]|nr:hypothetical protein BDZ45DRAFT_800042 [Acephala macrosclerotiorum]